MSPRISGSLLPPLERAIPLIMRTPRQREMCCLVQIERWFAPQWRYNVYPLIRPFFLSPSAKNPGGALARRRRGRPRQASGGTLDRGRERADAPLKERAGALCARLLSFRFVRDSCATARFTSYVDITPGACPPSK